MLVYTSSIWLDKATSLSQIISIYISWLHNKTNDYISPSIFLDQPNRSFTDGTTYEIIKSDANYPKLYSFSYREKDSEVSGRRWETQVGIKKESADSETQVSFKVEISEIGVLVPHLENTTRPKLIFEFIKQCKPIFPTTGINISTLETLDEIEALGYEIDSPERHSPIILVSPNAEGEYLVDLSKLFFKTCGLAQIYKISPKINSFDAEKLLGKTFTAYNGAVNVLFPMTPKKKQVVSKLYLSERITELQEHEIAFETEALNQIALRMNLPNSWIHISPEKIREEQRRIEFNELKQLRARSEETGDQQQYITELEDNDTRMRADIERLKSKISELESSNEYYFTEYEDADDERRFLQNKVEGLSSQLNDLSKSQHIKLASTSCSEEVLSLFGEYLSNSIVPFQCLELISSLFPDRVIILESAYKFSKESQGFLYTQKTFQLLWKLVTVYWDLLCSGKGDTEAKTIFGKDYSAKEAGLSQEGIRRRTFLYNGEKVFMEKHLKHGTKPSPAETIRIHFEWFEKEKKFVIGYCGPHLDQ
ncbi:MAG: hypothetical protein GYA58_03965 [Anaerolineaceae bacterium]|nr:hypothetical protein [Anaerolineaceae bacterium]